MDVPKIAAELKDLPHMAIGELVALQGELKELSEREYSKLKKSLLEEGVFVPFFAWNDDGTYYILDGHQRDRVFLNEGWEIDVPVVWVECRDREHAKKRLLLISSQYGKITMEGWDSFTFDLDEDWLQETTYFDALPYVFEDWAKEQTESDRIEDTPSELPGAAALKPYMNFQSDLPWDIPALLPDMLCSVPTPIDTWAGPDVCEDTGEGYWLYSWGSDVVRGLPFDRTLLAFYIDDSSFENFWFQPDVYVGKCLNRGVTMSIAPNYSLWSDAARATHLYNTFRSRWVARYMQEAGIYIVPDINWADRRSFEFCLLGIPENPPAVAVQLQTISTDEELRKAANGLQTALNMLKPEQLLVYGFTAAEKVMEKVKTDCEIIVVENRSAKRRIRHEFRAKEVLK